MQEWFDLNEVDRKEIIKQTSNKVGLVPAAIEKDWWVMIAMKAIFSSKYRDNIVFKGGTSLSKSWGIIERFSEDIDLAIDRSYFNFNGSLNNQQVKKLRKASCTFIVEKFMPYLEEHLHALGVQNFELAVVEFERSDTDPIAIELRYKSLTEEIEYLKPRILIEISSRSLRDPFEEKEIQSIIGKTYPNNKFSENPILVPAVLPSRTLLEKIFLLHEEFQRPDKTKIRSSRMTRHLYDISRIMDTEYLQEALDDDELFNVIVEHREMLTKVSWVDYAKHQKKDINFIPPKEIIKKWEKDYADMQESMFYGETESFDNLINKLDSLNKKINAL